ncbi:MAG: hypothetical protein ACE5IL_17325 [Myxococcota bacterium]
MSPFGWVRRGAQPRLLAGLSVLVGVVSVWLWVLGQGLVTPEASQGIVSFELARQLARSGQILDSWSPRARETAMLVQGLDYLYLCLYPAWLSLAAARLGARLGGRWSRTGLGVSWAVLGAGPLDAMENYALIQQLIHGPSPLHAPLAWACAVPKFALVALAGIFLVLGGGAWLIARVRPGGPVPSGFDR